MLSLVFVVQLRAIRDRDQTRIGIDCKPTFGIIIEAVSHDIGRIILIQGKSHDSHGRTVGRVLQDNVRHGVTVDRHRHVEFVQVVDRNDKVLRERRTGCIDDLDSNRVRNVLFAIQQRAIGDGDLPRVVNREAATGRIEQVIRKGIARVQVLTKDRSNHRAIGRILIDIQPTRDNIIRSIVGTLDGNRHLSCTGNTIGITHGVREDILQCIGVCTQCLHRRVAIVHGIGIGTISSNLDRAEGTIHHRGHGAHRGRNGAGGNSDHGLGIHDVGIGVIIQDIAIWVNAE